jgi:hypothetical protein
VIEEKPVDQYTFKINIKFFKWARLNVFKNTHLRHKNHKEILKKWYYISQNSVYVWGNGDFNLHILMFLGCIFIKVL